MRHFEHDERLFELVWYVVFRIVQIHGEQSYFRSL